MNERKVVLLTLALASILLLKASDKSAVSASESGDRLANKTKPVQVYILMGQSNMIGFGKVEPGKRGPQGSLSHAVKNEGKYAYLIEDSGNWTVRSDVRNVRVMGSGTGT